MPSTGLLDTVRNREPRASQIEGYLLLAFLYPQYPTLNRNVCLDFTAGVRVCQTLPDHMIEISSVSERRSESPLSASTQLDRVDTLGISQNIEAQNRDSQESFHRSNDLLDLVVQGNQMIRLDVDSITGH